MRVPVDLTPGLTSDNTPFSTQATYKAADKVRFFEGKAQVIGGWDRIHNNVMLGACRNVLPWRDNVGANMMAYGTNSNLYLYRSGAFADITPTANTSYLNVPIANSGINYYAANTTVSFPNPGAPYTQANATVEVSNGAITSLYFNSYGNYPPSTVLTAPSLSTTTGSQATFGNVVVQTGWTPGNVNGMTGPGFGYGGWGKGAYSQSSTAGQTTGPRTYGPLTWSFANFGQALIANPRGGAIYIWGLNSVTDLTQHAIPVGQIPGSDGYCPPQCNYAVVAPQRCIVALGTTQLDGTWNPLCIRISDIDGNITAWYPTTANAADEVILPSGGAIVAGRYFGETLAVFTNSNMFCGTYVGDADQTIRFDPVDGSTGLIGPNAAVVIGQTIFWLSPDLVLYTCLEGGFPVRVECPIRSDTLANVSPAQSDKIVLSYNAGFDELRIDYPDARDGNPGLENSRYLTLQISTGAWSQGMMARSAMDRGAPYQWPIGAETATLPLSYQGNVTNNASAATALATAQAALPAYSGLNLVTRGNAASVVGAVTVQPIYSGASGWGFQFAGLANGAVQQAEITGLGLTAGQHVSLSYKAEVITGPDVPLTVALATKGSDTDQASTLGYDTPPDFYSADPITIGLQSFAHPNIQVTSSADSLYLGFANTVLRPNAVVQITDIKVEAGSMQTAWTPSQSDPNLFANYAGFISTLEYPQLTSIAYYHDLNNTADEGVLDWSIETNYFALDDNLTSLLVTDFFPDFRDQLGDAELTIYFAQYPQDPNEFAVGPFAITPDLDRIDFMETGKFARFKVSGSGTEAYMRFGRSVFEVKPAGVR